MTRRSALPGLALAVAIAACQSVTPTPAPTVAPTRTPSPTASATPAPPPEEIYAAIREAVIEIRGLQPKKAVEPAVIDAAQLRANLEAEFDADNPAERLAASEQLLSALGLIPPGSSLRALTLDLQAGQVAGYYSPRTGELFVVSRAGGLGPLERSTYAHEFSHQLQDQRFDLDALALDDPDEGDRALARLALIEGDATSVQAAWMQAALTPDELGELLAQSLDPVGLAALSRAPAILRDTSLFPYQDGLSFVSGLLVEGGYAAVDAAYKQPPASTEQILHPEKYAAGEAPRRVAVADGLAGRLGPGWAEGTRDTLGEVVLRIWLRQGGVAPADARAAAAGWGGDRVVLFRGPGDALAVALVAEWDSAADAAEFATAARAALDGLGLTWRIVQRTGSERVVIAIGAKAVELAAAAGE